MSDKLKQSLIPVTTVAGEMPTSLKLNAAFAQVNSAIEVVDQALGDLYSQQIHVSSTGAYSLSELPVCGPNISRLVGSAGWLNPRHLGRIREEIYCIFASGRSLDGDPPGIRGVTDAHFNTVEFRLPQPPIIMTSTEGEESVTFKTSFDSSWAGAYWAITTPGAGYVDATAKVATRVDNLDDLSAAGEYHVSEDGVITLFEPLEDSGTPEGFLVTYTCDTYPDSGDGTGFNVIPDFSQTTDLCDCYLISTEVYDLYTPDITHRRSEALSTSYPAYHHFRSWDYADIEDPMNLAAPKLPLVIRANLSVGDTIPAGFIQLWDEVEQEVITGLTFTYRSATCVRASGRTLTVGSSRYRIITVGTDISRVVSDLRERFFFHDHSGHFSTTTGLFSGHRIPHWACSNLIDEGDDNGIGFTASTLGADKNPHPQYLHRHGYLPRGYTDGSATTGNRNNAFLGDFLISNEDGNVNLTTNSHNLYFGAVTGPNLQYRTYEDALILYTKPLILRAGVAAGAKNDVIKLARSSGDLSLGATSTTVTLTGITDCTHVLGCSFTTTITGSATDPIVYDVHNSGDNYVDTISYNMAANTFVITLHHPSLGSPPYRYSLIVFYY